MRRWVVRDRYGNDLYLTDERWEHILDGHPEVSEEDLRETVRTGVRRQDAGHPQKYRYLKPFSDLPFRNTHVEVVVLFRFEEDEHGRAVANNYVVPAYHKKFG